MLNKVEMFWQYLGGIEMLTEFADLIDVNAFWQYLGGIEIGSVDLELFDVTGFDSTLEELKSS